MCIPVHATGHDFTPAGQLVRADLIAGHWVATKLRDDHTIAAEIVGSGEHVHRRWSGGHHDCLLRLRLPAGQPFRRRRPTLWEASLPHLTRSAGPDGAAGATFVPIREEAS